MVERIGKLTRIGNYEFSVDKFLGKGSHGMAYSAYSLDDAPTCCVAKVIDSKLLPANTKISDFIREINMQKDLNHDNITKIYDAYEIDENGNKSICILMEFCRGGSLRDLINDKKIEKDELLIFDFIRQILTGFRYIHNKSGKQMFVHRDIKPENILIDNNIYKIADFGIAKASEKGEDIFASQAGCEYYLPPEYQIDRIIGPTIDVYSIGIVIYELMYGVRPTNDQLFSIIDIELPQTGIKWSPILVNLLKSMIKKEPKERTTFEELFKNPFIFTKVINETNGLDIMFNELLYSMQDRGFHFESPFIFEEDLNAMKNNISQSLICQSRSFEKIDTQVLSKSMDCIPPEKSNMRKYYDSNSSMTSPNRDKALCCSILVENFNEILLSKIYSAFCFYQFAYLFYEGCNNELGTIIASNYYELVFFCIRTAGNILNEMREVENYLFQSGNTIKENIKIFQKNKKCQGLADSISILIESNDKFESTFRSLAIEEGTLDPSEILAMEMSLNDDPSYLLKIIVEKALLGEETRVIQSIKEREMLVLIYYLQLFREKKYLIKSHIDSLSNYLNPNPAQIPLFINKINNMSKANLKMEIAACIESRKTGGIC